MTDKEKIADKIRKILAKAESVVGTPEAESLMSMAEEMLHQHNLTMLDLNTLDKDDPVDTDFEAVKYRVNDSWMNVLAGQVAHLYGCYPVVSRDHRTRHTKFMSVTGRLSNRTTFKLMMPFIKKQVLVTGRNLHREDPQSYSSERVAQRRVANALSIRIARMVEGNEIAEQNRVSKGGTALVPVDLIDAMVKEHFPNLRKARRTSRSTDGKARDAAGNISLYRQTGSDRQRMIR